MMYALPNDLYSRVHARLPEDLNVPKTSPWLQSQFGGRAAGSFIEGPAFDRAGNLYFVDIAHGRIFRLDSQGDFHLVADYDGEPNGLKIHADGRLFVADFRNGIMELDPINGRIKPFLPRDRFVDFKGFNDLFFASNGDLYFTDQGMTGLHDATGRVYRYRSDGRLDCLVDTIPSPNGLVMTPDESQLLVAVTRDNAIWRIPLGLDGRPFKVGRFIQMSGGGGPDGLAMDEDGNLAVAHIISASVWQFDAAGAPIVRIHSSAGNMPTNVAYGGANNSQLFITESQTGTILVADLPVPGRLMYSHQNDDS